MELKAVDRRSGLNRESFRKEYLTPKKPVIMTDFMDSWPAKNKWTIEYFKEKHGDVVVPVYSADYSNAGKGYMTADQQMKFGDYLEILETGPTDLRMFLFNIFKHAPSLCEDFSTPTIMDGWIKSYPFMFFGGEGSFVNMHYDIDMSHVFLNQFHGRKKVMLFPPEQSANIYHQPFTVASTVKDFTNPDLEKFPALKKAKGFECIVEPGETLFMPSGYWHFITYLDGGYSMSLRSNDSYLRRVKGMANIARHYVVDKGMNKIMGSSWSQVKTDIAKKRAEGSAAR